MRDIPVSTEVFAAIWSQRQEGESSESDILARILKIPRPRPAVTLVHGSSVRAKLPMYGGISIPEFGVHFREDQEIFRVYKRQRYVATVKGGRWWMNGKFYPSLHKLSMAIVKGRENSWNNWKTVNEFGKEIPIDKLRDQNLVPRR